MRNKINDEYRKNMNIGDVEQIKKVFKLIKNILENIINIEYNIYYFFQLNETALAVEKEVRTRIIQAVEKEPGKYGNYVNFNYLMFKDALVEYIIKSIFQLINITK